VTAVAIGFGTSPFAYSGFQISKTLSLLKLSSNAPETVPVAMRGSEDGNVAGDHDRVAVLLMYDRIAGRQSRERQVRPPFD
jgi:hypothetical protein